LVALVVVVVGYLEGQVADEEAEEPREGDEGQLELQSLEVLGHLRHVLGHQVLEHPLVGDRTQHVCVRTHHHVTVRTKSIV
jgi:hypothetical protein